MLELAGMTVTGPVREKNEDRLLINRQVIRTGSLSLSLDDSCLAAVFDGVGGEAYGAEAAELAALFLSVMDPADTTAERLVDWLHKTNQFLCNRQLLDHSHRYMSTTTAGVVVRGDDVFAFNIGDSRIYRYRHPCLLQLSEDHTMARSLQGLGLVVGRAFGNVVTRYLGGNSASPHLFGGTGQCLDGDLYLLCSDGLWSFVKEHELQATLAETDDLALGCTNLVQKALDNGSDDNISIIMIRKTSSG